MSNSICVISKNGERLMPTFRPGRVRHLLKDGKAKVVTIRQWDDMAEEFGVDEDILVPCGFLPEMRQYCNKRATVVRCNYFSISAKPSEYNRYELRFEGEREASKWDFSPGMFEPESPLEVSDLSTPPISFSVLLQSP